MALEEQLIMAVKKNPIIYDKLSQGYNRMLARESAWASISEKLGKKDIGFLKKRWRSLRDTFIKFYRTEKLQKTVDGSTTKKRKWRFYDSMVFLIPHIEYKITINSLNTTLEETSSQGEYKECEEYEEVKSETQDSIEENEILVQNENSIYLQMEEDSTEEPASKKSCSTLETYNTTLIETAGKSGDPDVHFLLSCVPSLKRLSPRKNLLARIKIQKLLYDFEFDNENHYN